VTINKKQIFRHLWIGNALMSQQFIGEIRIFGFAFAPRNWAQANGQLLPIQQNAALFSLLGTTYGGNGMANFALPNLQGRTPIHWGSGAGLPVFVQGQTGGEVSHTLTSATMPAHTHGVAATTAAATATAPDAAIPASAGHQPYRTGGTAVAMKTGLVNAAGGAQSHPNMQPYTVLNFCIALSGTFPARN
jgi:microcystin-dependent protein